MITHSLSVSHGSSLSVTGPLRHLSITIITMCVALSFIVSLRITTVSHSPHLPPGRFQVHRVHSPGKVKRLSSCKRKGCALAEVGIKLHRSASDVGRSCDPGMANKENELTCSDDIRGIHCNDNRGLPVNSAEASKMAGASSKYSDFTEVRNEAACLMKNAHLIVSISFSPGDDEAATF